MPATAATPRLPTLSAICATAPTPELAEAFETLAARLATHLPGQPGCEVLQDVWRVLCALGDQAAHARPGASMALTLSALVDVLPSDDETTVH